MRVHKAAGGALVRAQRTEQTISPTLHGRTRTIVPSPVCLRARSYCSGRDGRVTYVTPARVVRVCACARASLTLNEGYVRLQTASVQRIFRRGVVVGPGRILRAARSLNPPVPSGPRFPSLPGVRGRRRELLLCSTFAGTILQLE